MDPDPGGPKTCGSGPPTLEARICNRNKFSGFTTLPLLIFFYFHLCKAGNHYAAYAYPPAGAPPAYPPYGGGYASMPAPPGYPARPLPPPAGAAHRKPDNGKPES
jgi:hypothetical protein